MIATILAALALGPTLSVSGHTLHWTSMGRGSYRVGTKLPGRRARSKIVRSTEYQPRAHPGETVTYEVRAVHDGTWSNEVTISWPLNEPPPVEEAEEPPAEEAEEPPAEEPPVEEKPAEEPPVEEEPPHTSGFLVGLNAGYWNGEQSDLHTMGAKVVRLDTPSDTSAWEGAGLKVIADMSGPYSSAGVSGVNVSNYVARDLALVKRDPHLYALETLNEPGGNWFWGGSSESATNREAYARLVVAVHQALVREFGAARPLQLCSYDGGHDSSVAWGEAWTEVPGALAACDGITVHPYGGTGTRANAILGNRRQVETAEHVGKPVYVTEIGFPTKGPTGDSLKYTEAEQAWALYQFDEWAAAQPDVPAVTEYGYRDGEEGGGYGVETHAGVKKLAWTAMQELTRSLACTVCQP